MEQPDHLPIGAGVVAHDQAAEPDQDVAYPRRLVGPPELGADRAQQVQRHDRACSGRSEWGQHRIEPIVPFQLVGGSDVVKGFVVEHRQQPGPVLTFGQPAEQVLPCGFF